MVDLTGKLPPHVRRIRMRTNLQIYWDQILVDNGADASPSMHKTELPLASASVAFRGYPKQIDGETPGDLTYDYQRISLTGPFPMAAWKLYALRFCNSASAAGGMTNT